MDGHRPGDGCAGDMNNAQALGRSTARRRLFAGRRPALNTGYCRLKALSGSLKPVYSRGHKKPASGGPDWCFQIRNAAKQRGRARAAARGNIPTRPVPPFRVSSKLRLHSTSRFSAAPRLTSSTGRGGEARNSSSGSSPLVLEADIPLPRIAPRLVQVEREALLASHKFPGGRHLPVKKAARDSQRSPLLRTPLSFRVFCVNPFDLHDKRIRPHLDDLRSHKTAE